MRRVMALGLALLSTACTAAQAPSQAPACTGGANLAFGCIAKVMVGGVAYQDWGYLAVTDDGKAKLASSGTLTNAVEWLPSLNPNRNPQAVHDEQVNYAGAGVWAVPGVDPRHVLLLGPFRVVWEPNLYELFLAQGGSQDFPVGLCPYLKPSGTSKTVPPPVCP